MLNWNKLGRQIVMGIVGSLILASTPAWALETNSTASEPELAAASASKPDIQVDDETVNKDFIRYEKDKGLRVGNKISFFGYGEMHYNNVIGSSGDKFDFHRFVIGLGVDFTDWLIFRSEIDFEHAAQELELEIAYLDFLIHDLINVRTGITLIPVGFLNEHHEPTLFYSVERPQFNTVIIPTTWFAAAIGIHGETDFGLGYQLYLTESLDAVNESDAGKGFTGSKGLRNARRKTSEAPGRDVAGVARLEYKGVQGLQLGTSFWVGNTGQGNATTNGGLTTIIEGDLRFQIEGLEFVGVGAWIHMSDAAAINNAILAVDPTFSDFVASDIVGYYFELAYHLFHHIWPETSHDVVIFGRHERYNTQHKMPTGFASNTANNRNTTTFGVAYFPIDQVAIKLDYSLNRNGAGTASDQLNAGFAFTY